MGFVLLATKVVEKIKLNKNHRGEFPATTKSSYNTVYRYKHIIMIDIINKVIISSLSLKALLVA